MDWYPFYYIAYKADTLNFSLAEDGAYRRLIDFYMETREPLPDNEAALCRIIGIGINEFRTVAEQVLSKFESIDGVLHNEKCNTELDRQDRLTKKRSTAGKKSAEKRNKNNKMSTGVKQKPNTCMDTGQDRTGEDKESKTLVVNNDSQKAFDLFCQFADNTKLPVPLDFTDIRKSKMRATLKRCGGIDGWKAVLEKVGASSHCKGVNDRGWKANIDFLLTPSKLTKLMEGNFDDNPNSNNQTTGSGGNIVDAANRWANS